MGESDDTISSDMKQALRKILLEKRKDVSFVWKTKAEKKIRQKLFSLPYFKKAKVIFCYVSKPDEVDTLEIIHRLFQASRNVVVPRVKGKKLSPFLIEHFDHLEEGTFGIFEPKRYQPKIKSNAIDCAIVPGIAFDRQGHRLGYGHGYFDRFLKKLKCKKIGICFDFQIVDKLKTHAYDTPVDVVVTEKKIYVPSPSKTGS